MRRILSTPCWCARAGCGDFNSAPIIPKEKSREHHRVRAPSQSDEVQPREVFGRAMCDFGKSGYATVVVAAVFNA